MSPIDHPLDFEKELVGLEIELEKLQDEIAGGNLARRSDYSKLEAKVNKMRAEVYGKLTPYQRVMLSRHRDRPFTLDFIRHCFTNFVELSGDRLFRDDPAIVGGTARLGNINVMVVGHQRGRTPQELQHRNFGMAQPEGYRKALRLFRQAEKFELPIITFIDTMGAFPGLEAEERGQASAIAVNLAEMSELTTPIICVVIGEGGSGGALALGVGDRLLMLENACYSVITPEGCASILWPTDPVAQKAPVAAEILKITATPLKELGVVDEIVPEPAGGAHSNHREAAENLKEALLRHLKDLAKKKSSVDELLQERYNKFRKLGAFVTA